MLTGHSQGVSSGETVSERVLLEVTTEAKAVRPVGSGLDRPTGEAENRESHVRKGRKAGLGTS